MTDQGLIVVAGATGRQGGATARRLLAAGGWRVRGLSRDPAKPAARALADLGMEVMQAEMEDRPSLDRALEGAYGVFSVQNTWTAGVEGEIRQGKNLADAAQAAGVQHFVYTSVGGAERNTGIPHFDSKRVIEQHLRGLGLPATILRPVFFMDNFHDPQFRESIMGGTFSMALRPETRLQMIAVEDIGVFAAMAFSAPREWIGRELELAGDELNMLEIALAFSRTLARTVAFEPMPIEQVRAWSEDYAIMLEWFEREGYRADIAALRRMHPGLVTFEQWLEKWSRSG